MEQLADSDVRSHGEITRLLHEWSGGQPLDNGELFKMVYPQLRGIAGALFRGERPENILQPTCLVNELFIKLIRQRKIEFHDRTHFYSFAAGVMRRILIDHARGQGRRKRDGGAPIPLTDDMVWERARQGELIDLERVLRELEALDPRKCRMVELRYFLGFTAEETADLLQLSKASVDRDLRFTRAWLHDRLLNHAVVDAESTSGPAVPALQDAVPAKKPAQGPSPGSRLNGLVRDPQLRPAEG